MVIVENFTKDKQREDSMKRLKLICFFTMVLLICNLYTTVVQEDTKFNVHFIDVGRGDAILIQYEDSNLLIDTGKESSYRKLKRYLKRKKVKEINNLVITHPDADHIGAADFVMRDFSVEKIYMTTYTRTTDEYKEMIEAIKKYKVERINTKEGSKIPIGSLESVVLAADAKAENPNASSIVLKLQYEDIKFLFTGDAPAELENNIREKYDIDVDILKVAHHGSKNSCSILFLKEASPEYAIISVGANNKYGHPVDAVLRRLSKYSKHILRTDLDGSIVITCENNVVTVR